MKITKIFNKIKEEDEEGMSGLNSGVLGGNIHGGDVTNSDFYAPNDNRVPSLLFKKPLKRKKKLFENIINESSLEYQTVYRFTTFDELMQLFRGKWAFDYNNTKSFTRDIQARLIGVFAAQKDVLIEVDKNALEYFSKGKIKFSPFNYFASKENERSKATSARTRGVEGEYDFTEAEEQAKLSDKSRFFTFNPSNLSKFLKCIYISKSLKEIAFAEDEADDFSENENKLKRSSTKQKLIDRFNIIKMFCRRFNIKLRTLPSFRETPFYPSKKLDKIRDNINESVAASKLNMFEKTNKQLRNDAIKNSMEKRIDTNILDYLTLDDISASDKQRIEELSNTMSIKEAFVKTVLSSQNKLEYLKKVDERGKAEREKFFSDIHKELAKDYKK